MIFACDLDQTLIFSRNSMGLIDADELIPVESIEGKSHSFMTVAGWRSLNQISQHIQFVPATTRIYEQYRRIFGITEELKPHYAVISNGGRVLIDGQSDLAWERQVRQKVSKECVSHLEVKSKFDKLVSGDWILKDTYCDDLFYSVIVKRDLLPPDLMLEIESLLQGTGWGSSLQGRKIYLVPDHVSKGAAVQYVQELSGAPCVFAAGDSLLDESMLAIADVAMAPKHGELFRKYGKHDHIRFTEHTGIRATEEILDALMKRVEVKNAL